jgi:histone-lysine N-methyltransferase ASH1L
LSALNKRGKKAAQKALGGLSRELKRLQDTNEFLHIDTRPVRYTVWSNGKYVDTDPSQPTAPEPPRKKVKVDKNAAGEQETSETGKPEAGVPATNKPRVKKWLEKGLYAGQEAPVDIFQGLTAQEKKKLASIPELLRSSKPNRTFPLPMYNGLRILIHGRDFKLPFDICNPLPPGQPKPAAYRTMTKSKDFCFPSQHVAHHGRAISANMQRFRPVRWQRGSVLEEDTSFWGLRIQVRLQAGRWLRRGLPESHHVV